MRTINFEGFNLSFNINNVLFDINGIKIYWYAICIVVGIVISLLLCKRDNGKYNIKFDDILLLSIFLFPMAIIGARLYYVAFNIEYFINNPQEILSIQNGGLAIYGGIIGAVITIIVFCLIKKISIIDMLDFLVPYLALGQAFGRWGNFFNGEAYGRIVSLNYLKSLHLPNFIINGMYIDNAYREPTFLYESVLSLIGFIFMIIIRKKRNIKVGTLSGIYLIWYGIERLIIESFRSDSLMLFNIKVAQLVSVIFILSGLFIIYKSTKNNKLYKEEKIFL